MQSIFFCKNQKRWDKSRSISMEFQIVWNFAGRQFVDKSLSLAKKIIKSLGRFFWRKSTISGPACASGRLTTTPSTKDMTFCQSKSRISPISTGRIKFDYVYSLDLIKKGCHESQNRKKFWCIVMRSVPIRDYQEKVRRLTVPKAGSGTGPCVPSYSEKPSDSQDKSTVRKKDKNLGTQNRFLIIVLNWGVIMWHNSIEIEDFCHLLRPGQTVGL